MVILGLNAFHGDSSAALVRDGVLSRRQKRSASGASSIGPGSPSEAIAYCLREAGFTLATSTISPSIRTAAPTF